MRTNFRRRTTCVWVLDFNLYSKWEEQMGLQRPDDLIAHLVATFFENDPYYPRPSQDIEPDKSLWFTFSSSYRDAAASVLAAGCIRSIENANITVPVVDPAPVVTSTSLNTAILAQLQTALRGLHDKAGVPTHARVTINNVNITTNIIVKKRAPPIAPDTSLLQRVKRAPTEPGSSIPKTGPVPTSTTHTKPAFAQPSFASHGSRVCPSI
ncbi:hypothetical protein N7455_004234 [Penicillium solitum]|uniref:uncharacterized protein n=1 Tax=Penicillium solitum TaxID=60172 RepID=UPI0032C49030|nr:hypothetical protein N7455_004234 [Penicillium solitum]